MSAAQPDDTLRYDYIKPCHLDEVMAIEVEAYPEPWSRGMFRQEMQGRQSHFFVVFLEGTLIGYSGFWLVEDEAHVTSVTVRDDFRGQGYGRQLAEYLLQQAVRLGARTASLEVRESNHRAISLYRNLGFQAVGRRKRYYSKSNEDALVMAKALDPRPAKRNLA